MLQSPIQIVTFILLLLTEGWAVVLLVKLLVHIQLLDGHSLFPRPDSVLFHISRGYVMAIKVRPQSSQQRLRITTVALYLICNLLRMTIYYIEAVTQRPVYDDVHSKQYYFLSIVYNVTFWLGYSSYILAVSDRFQRIEMIVPNTIRYRIYKATHWIIGVVLGLVLSIRTVCQVKSMIPPKELCPAEINAMADIYLLMTALGFVLTELVFNIRLILSSLRAIMTAPLTTTINQAISLDITPAPSPEPLNANEDDIGPLPACKHTALGKQMEMQTSSNPIRKRQQRKLFHIANIRYEMMFYFGLLVVLDLSIIGMQTLAGLVRSAAFDPQVPANELEAWCSMLIIVHLYFGFKLLDLFLFKLQETKLKSFDTTVGQNARHNYYNKNSNLSSNIPSTVTGAELVTTGLLSLSFILGPKSWASSAEPQKMEHFINESKH